MKTIKKPLTRDHWMNLLAIGEYNEDVKKIDINENEDFTIMQLLDAKLDTKRGEIEVISKEAEKQYNIELKLK